MNHARTRMLSLFLAVAVPGMILPKPSFATARQQVTLAEYEGILADAIKKGCTQVKNYR